MIASSRFSSFQSYSSRAWGEFCVSTTLRTIILNIVVVVVVVLFATPNTGKLFKRETGRQNDERPADLAARKQTIKRRDSSSTYLPVSISAFLVRPNQEIEETKSLF